MFSFGLMLDIYIYIFYPDLYFIYSIYLVLCTQWSHVYPFLGRVRVRGLRFDPIHFLSCFKEISR
jgi:hypothetical protein